MKILGRIMAGYKKRETVERRKKRARKETMVKEKSLDRSRSKVLVYIYDIHNNTGIKYNALDKK